MHEVFFETAVVAIKHNGDVLIALFDGVMEHATKPQCVALLSCKRETGIAFAAGLGSALKAAAAKGDKEC